MNIYIYSILFWTYSTYTYSYCIKKITFFKYVVLHELVKCDIIYLRRSAMQFAVVCIVPHFEKIWPHLNKIFSKYILILENREKWINNLIYIETNELLVISINGRGGKKVLIWSDSGRIKPFGMIWFVSILEWLQIHFRYEVWHLGPLWDIYPAGSMHPLRSKNGRLP